MTVPSDKNKLKRNFMAQKSELKIAIKRNINIIAVSARQHRKGHGEHDEPRRTRRDFQFYVALAVTLGLSNK